MLALVGRTGFQRRLAAAARDYRGHAVWTEVVLCSTVILQAAERGERNPRHERFLVEALRTGATGEVWHGNLFAHLIALHAVRTFAPDGPLLREGVTALTRTINPDGGVPFLAAQDVWVSALAGEVLSEVPGARAAASRIGEFIAARQLPDGGWGYCRYTKQSDVDDTSRCVALLHSLDPDRHGRAVARGRSNLLRSECPAGGFPTYRSQDPAEPDLTAGAVLALAPEPAAVPAVDRAVDFLVAAQNQDGTFEPSWTCSESSVLCHVTQALQAVQRSNPSRGAELQAAAVRRLSETQNDDGGWGHHLGDPSDVISTSHAVRLLAHRDPGRTARAIDYLLAAREPGGGFSSVPDQVGPRPLSYSYPILTDIHVLGALNTVLQAGSSNGLRAAALLLEGL